MLATFFEHSRANDAIRAAELPEARPRSTLSSLRRAETSVSTRRSSLPEPVRSTEQTSNAPAAPHIRGRVFDLGSNEMRVFLEELFEVFNISVL